MAALLSRNLVKRSLAGHAWLGVMVSALMYVICLSGTLLVLHAELEQWEQADAPVVNQLDMVAAEQTFNRFLADGQGVTPHMYLVLPTDDTPHARLASENESWFLHADGSLGPVEDNTWSTLLLDLHLYLHLPQSWGMILVSALGAVLVGLIVSGFLAHPGIFKDAFRLRQRSSEQLAQTDLHNRLSVWGAPFHLTIAITGAYFGLALPLLAIVAEAEFAGERDRVVSAVFGAEPELAPQSGPVAINTALEQIRIMEPTATPFNVIVHDADSPRPMLEIYARHPQRLTWGEAYQFSIDGQFVQQAGWAEGSVGQQILYSIYRLHFGTFDGMLSKVLYLILGLALTVVAASGVNIWLAKRRQDDGLNDLWVGIVWGTPLALVASAFVSLFTSLWLALVFWAVLIGACAMCLLRRDVAGSRRYLQITLAGACATLFVTHVMLFGAAAVDGGALLVNAGLLGLATILLVFTARGRKRAAEVFAT